MYYTVPTKLKRVDFYFLSARFLSMFKADTLNNTFLNTFSTPGGTALGLTVNGVRCKQILLPMFSFPFVDFAL